MTSDDKAREWLRKVNASILPSGDVWVNGKLLPKSKANWYKRIYKTICQTPVKS